MYIEMYMHNEIKYSGAQDTLTTISVKERVQISANAKFARLPSFTKTMFETKKTVSNRECNLNVKTYALLFTCVSTRAVHI